MDAPKANISITIENTYRLFPFGYTVNSAVWLTDQFEPVFKNTAQVFTKKRARKVATITAMALQFAIDTQGLESLNVNR